VVRPVVARQYVGKIRDALIALDPRERAYSTNAQKYSDQLVGLEASSRQRSRPFRRRRKLVTSHDAFPYFARHSGFRGHRFRAAEPDKLPSAGELADLVDKVKAAKAPAISPRRVLASARRDHREGDRREIITDLPTDSLLDKPADSYIGLMRVVVDKIVAALK